MFLLGIFGSVTLLIGLVVGFIAFSAIHYMPILAIILGGFVTARISGGFLRGIIAGAIIGVIMAAVVPILPAIGDFEPDILGWGAARNADISWVTNRYFSYAILGAIGGLFAAIRKRI
jgi:hypothetical protein